MLSIIFIAVSIRMVYSFMRRTPTVSDYATQGRLIKCSIGDMEYEGRSSHDFLRCKKSHKKTMGVKLSMVSNDESAMAIGWNVIKDGYLYLPKGAKYTVTF